MGAYPVKSSFREPKFIGGRFLPDTANPPTYPAADQHPGWNVAYTSTGLFTVTFTERFAVLVALQQPSVMLAAAADLVAQYGVYTPATAAAYATLQIRLLAVAALTQMAANAGNQVHWGCWVSTAEKIT